MRKRSTNSISSSRYVLSLASGLLLAAAPGTPPISSDCQDYEGLRHCAVGGATLRPTEGALEVKISKEEGGVRIEAPGRTSWAGKFAPVVLDRGAFMTLTATGLLPDGSTEQVARISAVNDPELPGTNAIYLDMSASESQTFSYRGYRQGYLVCQGSGITAEPSLSHSRQALPILGLLVAKYILDHADAHVEYSQKDGWSGGLSWNKSGRVVIGPNESEECEADLIMFTPDLQPYSAQQLDSVELTGTSLDGFNILYEDVDCVPFSGMQHCALGGSVLEPSDEGLLVRRANGEGSGVRITTAGAGSWDAWLAPIEPQEDSRMVMTFRGMRADGSVQVLEQVAVTRSPGSGDDFNGAYVKPSVHGAATYTVRGYREGELVFERANVEPMPEDIGGPHGPGDDQWMRLISFPGSWQSSHSVYSPDGNGGCTPGLDFPWPRPIRFPDFMMTEEVDLVTFEAEDVHSGSEQFLDVSLEGVGMESFQLLRENRSR